MEKHVPTYTDHLICTTTTWEFARVQPPYGDKWIVGLQGLFSHSSRGCPKEATEPRETYAQYIYIYIYLRKRQDPRHVVSSYARRCTRVCVTLPHVWSSQGLSPELWLLYLRYRLFFLSSGDTRKKSFSIQQRITENSCWQHRTNSKCVKKWFRYIVISFPCKNNTLYCIQIWIYAFKRVVQCYFYARNEMAHIYWSHTLYIWICSKLSDPRIWNSNESDITIVT